MGLSAHISAAITNREARSAIEKGQKVECGREVVHKIADAVLAIMSLGRRVGVFLVPCDTGIRGVAEARQAAKSAIEIGSDLTIALPG